MNKHAWINIAVCIDVEVSAASGYTALYILCVVLEVHGKQRFCSPVMTDATVGLCPLFRIWHQFRRSIISYRHVVEIPDKVSAHINQAVIEFL